MKCNSYCTYLDGLPAQRWSLLLTVTALDQISGGAITVYKHSMQETQTFPNISECNMTQRQRACTVFIGHSL